MLLMWLKKLSSFAFWMITKVSSTNLLQKVGGSGAVLMASFSKASIYKLAIMGLNGEPKAAPSVCSWYLPWKMKLVWWNPFPRSRTFFRPSQHMSHLCWSGECIYLTFRLHGHMGSSGWSPGLWKRSNSAGDPGFVRLCHMSPIILGTDNKPRNEHDQWEGDWCPGDAMGKCLGGPSPTATVEDDQAAGNSNLGGTMK